MDNKYINTFIKNSHTLLGSVLFGSIILAYPQKSLAQALQNPINATSPGILIGRFIATVIPMLGVAAVIMFVVGAIHWIISSGNPESVKKGRDTLVWAVIGAAVAIGSYVGLKFIIQALTQGMRFT